MNFINIELSGLLLIRVYVFFIGKIKNWESWVNE